ncbi:hypothetical protein HHK36_001857 [Tetracentron sinense]|uniref:Phytocyanin domain-containing protein n=1 Tax=Tetracentron sinense TaxID=13715 RepID=A0A835DRH7_TETSI|nr:hypothetical protein HHK36_001857 [Tetracentron sinense]
MESQRYISFLLVILMGFFCSSQAYKFYVGGSDGWVLKPSENYNHWAERNRFQVSDSLFFKHKKGSDSVLVVTKEDYYNCNTEKPIMAMVDGDSIFKFDRSGPFFFISGNPGSCGNGQKLIVVVLAVRDKSPIAKPPMSSQSPKAQPPKAMTPVSPSPVAKTPTVSPSPAMIPVSPSPKSGTPMSSPPMADTPTPDGDTHSELHAPAPAPSSSPAFTSSIDLVFGVSLVVCVVLGSFVGTF